MNTHPPASFDTATWITLRWTRGTRYFRVHLEQDLWSNWLMTQVNGRDSCDAFAVRVFDHGAHRYWSLPLEFLVFGKDPNRDRLLVEYTRTR
jgi:hypothetical protein